MQDHDNKMGKPGFPHPQMGGKPPFGGPPPFGDHPLMGDRPVRKGPPMADM